MPFNYSLEIVHKDGAVVKTSNTFNGPHLTSLTLEKPTLDARLEELAQIGENPGQTRMRLTLNETQQESGTGPSLPPVYNYKLFLVHKNSEGNVRTMHMFNGPHRARFQPATSALKISLAELELDPLRPTDVRLALTMTEA
jgi:hypothetical protein